MLKISVGQGKRGRRENEAEGMQVSRLIDGSKEEKGVGRQGSIASPTINLRRWGGKGWKGGGVPQRLKKTTTRFLLTSQLGRGTDKKKRGKRFRGRLSQKRKRSQVPPKVPFIALFRASRHVLDKREKGRKKKGAKCLWTPASRLN